MVHLSEPDQQVNLMDVPVGVPVHIKTGNSNWYICRVDGSTLEKLGYVRGIMLMTDSKDFEQVPDSPLQMLISSEIKVGERIRIMGRSQYSETGVVRSITHEQT